MVDVARMEILAKITGVSCPQRLIIHPGRRWVYVIDNYLDRFHVIDRVHRRLVKSIFPGDDPSGIAFDSRGKCYLANFWSNDFAVVDLETEEVEERVALRGAAPHSLWFDPHHRKMFVTNGSSNGILVMDPDTGNVVDQLVMPDGAYGGPLTVNRARGRLYVADDWRSGVGIYPLDTADPGYQTPHHERKFISLPGAHPSGIAAAPGDRLCVPFVKGDRLTLALVDQEQEAVEAEIDLGAGLQTGGVAVNERKKVAYVADYSGARLIAVDLKRKQVCGAVSLERQPSAVAVHPESGLIYVCNPGSNSVAVVADDPLETLGFIDVGAAPSAIAFSPSKARLYVTNSGDGTVSVVNELSHRVVETVPVGEDARQLVVENDNLYVASAARGRISTLRDTFRLAPSFNNDRSASDTAFRFREAYGYPNPARGTNPVLRAQVGLADAVQFSIYDVSGALVHEAAAPAAVLTENGYVYDYAWDVSSVASGVYLVSLCAKKAGETDIRKTFKVAVLK